MLKTGASSGRLSVRGAFGPSGSLFKGGGAGKGAEVLPSRAQLFQLDKCLDKKALDKVIYQMQGTSDAIDKTKLAAYNRQSTSFAYNVDGFAHFLAQNKSLAMLLFWKDAEEYASLFGDEERKQTAKKIFNRYLTEGSEFEVLSLPKEMRKKIQEDLDFPTDELFSELQTEAYSFMLFDLFPRFYDACKDAPQESRSSQITESTTLTEILAVQTFEVHLFAEFCKEQFCEDQVIFLLEVGDYRLLFTPQDKLDQAKRIYQIYLDDKSEARIAGSVSEFSRIKETIDKGDGAGKAELDSTLFDKVASEVTGTLSMDMWPRYKEAVIQGKDMKATALTGSSSVDMTNLVDLTRPSKKAVAALLRQPDKLEVLRNAAAAQGVRENVDFCVQCQSYKLLFSESDRIPRAKTIWDTFLAPSAETPINISDTLIKKCEPKVQTADPEAFELPYNEVLQIISDNLFAHYMKAIEHAEKEKKQAEEAAAEAPAPAPPPESGGCCLLM